MSFIISTINHTKPMKKYSETMWYPRTVLWIEVTPIFLLLYLYSQSQDNDEKLFLAEIVLVILLVLAYGYAVVFNLGLTDNALHYRVGSLGKSKVIRREEVQSMEVVYVNVYNRLGG